jgi:hypothetical protein
MEQVLEHTCRSLPYGGDHDLRAFIADRLIGATIAGRTTLGELGITARKALADYQATPNSQPPSSASEAAFSSHGSGRAAPSVP